MPVHETDICIIGGGITSAMLAQTLSELRPGITITVVEAGRSIFDAENRGRYRQRAMDYGEHPWHDDFIEDQQAKGIISMTMAVGGLALHWGGACNRFSEEDLRLKSLYGLADDWPLEWKDLELTAEVVKGKAQGKTDPGAVACGAAPCIHYQGAYGLIGYRLTNTWQPYLRGDFRDAVHQAGASFVYISKLARFTAGVRAELGTQVIVKAEYTVNQELGRIPQFPDDIFTSALVVKF